jgi:glucose/arabinose dehydrogenase
MAVQQAGRVLLFTNGVQQERPFLDLRSVVRAEGEGGLLSLAFAPDYAGSGLFYAFFTNNAGNIRVVEMRRSSEDPDVAEAASRRRVLAIQKLAPNHNGGMMQFGPDGYLYLSVGDGGASPPALPVGRFGQTLTDLFATILRIDPRARTPYAIPPDNPFVDVPEARPEIVAYGLRNPWRFWIDARTRTMLIGDVGEADREEINRLSIDRLGLNFGWPCKEGTVTSVSEADVPSSCASATLTAPVHEYSHAAKRCSITGGVVSRDPGIRALDGLYIWADFCEGVVRGLTPVGQNVPLGLRVERSSSFGVDGLGRMYVVTTLGELYRFEVTGG